MQVQTEARSEFALPFITPPASTRTNIIRQMVNGLAPNLKASELAVPQQGPSMRLLVIEDFETTGLQGAVDVKDDGQFCGFWRRFGRSNKKQAEGGRWGLGKTGVSKRLAGAHCGRPDTACRRPKQLANGSSNSSQP